MNKGLSFTPCQILIAIHEVLVRYAMGLMFGMFLFAFQVFSTPKCEDVIFSKFELVCVHARPLRYLDMLIFYRACAPCMHACDVHAKHDITRGCM